LTELDVSNSHGVTNASVQPLQAARELKFLELYGTRIDDEHYGLLLSELPNVANITIWRKGISILRHIAVERLYTITHVTQYILDTGTETVVCCNRSISNIDRIMVDLSGLSAFNALRVLEIHGPDCTSSNIRTLLQAVGHRLTDLKLFDCCCRDIQDIITLCPLLTDLSLIFCPFVSSHPQTQLDPQLPHFRNLINLEIYDAKNLNDFFYLPYYVSVKTVDVTLTGHFDRFVREILNLGTYKQLELLRVQKTAPRSINRKAVELLIGHCPLLKLIELVGTADDSEECDFEALKHKISLQSLNLKLKTYLY
jgi:hypothetical protein